MPATCRCPCHKGRGSDHCSDPDCECPCHQFAEFHPIDLCWVHTGIDRTAPHGPRVTWLLSARDVTLARPMVAAARMGEARKARRLANPFPLQNRRTENMPKGQATLPTECDIDEIALGTNVREVDTKSPAFAELVESIKNHGIIEPVVVRALVPPVNGHRLELVAGYRRLAAAREAKLKTVPFVAHQLNDTERAEVQLLENLLRKDLTPMEEARGIHAYSEAAKVNPNEISARLHKSVAYVKGRLSLLNLVPAMQKLLEEGGVSVGTAIVVAGFTAPVQEAAFSDRYVLHDDPKRIVGQLRSIEEQVRRSEKFRAKVEGSKFPTCPKCKTAPERESYDGLALCEQQHEWSLATGKGRSTRENIGSYNRQPRVEIDRTETPFVRAWRTPWALLQQFVDDSTIQQVEFQGKAEGGMIVIQVGKFPGLGAKDYVEAKLWPVSYSTGESTQVQVAGQEAKERTKLKAMLAKLLASVDESGKAKKAKELDTAAFLAGEREDVLKRIAKIKDRETLERVREAEVNGAARASILIELDKHSEYGLGYDDEY